MAETGLVWGLHSVQALLARPGSVVELWTDSARHDQRLAALQRELTTAGIAWQEVGRRELDRLASGENHQGVVARVELRPAGSERDLEQLLVDLTLPPFLLVLDGVTDPHNLGACLRSADAAGVQAVIAPRDRACGLTAVARKVASGAAESVPFIQVTNLARTLRFLKENGVWVVGTAGEGEQSLYDTQLTGPLALVLGAEGSGLRRLTREVCDLLVRIPMAGSVSSLNVSVAAGVVLFEALRQRGGAG